MVDITGDNNSFDDLSFVKMIPNCVALNLSSSKLTSIEQLKPLKDLTELRALELGETAAKQFGYPSEDEFRKEVYLH